ncbi:hypothetical protein N7478_011425 [Penicillium angulare]|uniref:uncharacterized protein n=1 Tax=Penicillium angulare TaxID=116970 RepID=UPI00253FE2CF|nr:uncharacterized protein N7478_011425 [Penicillium angulare]KAJ5263820.1 hypothetical protein N7478_011425 [Penicillium angulare]
MSAEWSNTSIGSDRASGHTRRGNRNIQDHTHPRRPRGKEEPPRKRPKRGKYCEGGYPCSACIAKGLDCVTRNAEIRHDSATSQSQNSRGDKEDVILALGNIQRQLNHILKQNGKSTVAGSETSNTPTSVHNPVQFPAPSYHTAQSQYTPKSDTEVFSGEPSLVHVLHEMEGTLEKLGIRNKFMASPPPSLPLTPVYYQSQVEGETSHIKAVLQSHGIIPDREEWDELLHSFVDDVHILYPFLHLPILKNTYEGLWDRVIVPSCSSYKDNNHRVKIAQVLFCLATGRCNESTRKDTEGHHSAGWSLFQAGMDVLGDPLEILDDFSVSLPALQAIILAVIYLFRIDANNKTEKFLALVVSHSHLLGLHRKRVTDDMPIFEAEMFKRLWWCTYIMDRRLAIDTGRPFLIQDVNTDVPVPLGLGEDWLSCHASTMLTSKELRKEIEVEINRDVPTPLSHIAAMADFSRVVGKVWEAYYGALDRNAISTPLTAEYLEVLISSTVQREPSRAWSGSREPFHRQFAGMEWWLIKQKMLMRIRWTFLRLLIRKSSLDSSSLFSDEANANGVTCLQLCRAIVLEFNYIPDKYPKHTFPFINYVATAAMIALGLIIKQPTFSSLDLTFVVQAARMLERFCTQTWVSGRIIRAATRINQVTALVFDKNGNPRERASGIINEPRCDLSSDPIHDNGRASRRKGSFSDDSRIGPPNGNARGHFFNGDNYRHSSNSNTMAQSPNVNFQCASSDDTLEVPSFLPSANSVFISSGLEDLVMTDFDFEEVLQHGSQLNGSWPCLPEFLEPTAPLQEDSSDFSII